MYKDIFTNLGLSQNEAIIYEYLLKNGESPAGIIIKKTPLKRGVVYNALDDLIKKNLAFKKNRNKIAYFSPNHPETLRDFMENKEDEVKKAKKTLEANLETLISDYNLSSKKPGVRYFEGEDGLRKMLQDVLTAKETIYTYADVEAVVKYMDKINQEHVRQREKLNIKKRIIFVDSPFARKYLKNYHVNVTDSRFVDYKLYPFSSLMQIYDGKVAYISLSEKGIVSMIITDQNIYQMNKSIFEFVWAYSKTFDQLEPLSADRSKAQ